MGSAVDTRSRRIFIVENHSPTALVGCLRTVGSDLAATVIVGAGAADKNPTAFGDDAGTLSKKFTGLARVMAGKYEWKPGQGVRSVSDVFNRIVEENGLLADALSGTPNKGQSPCALPIRGKCKTL